MTGILDRLHGPPAGPDSGEIPRGSLTVPAEVARNAHSPAVRRGPFSGLYAPGPVGRVRDFTPSGRWFLSC